MAPPTRPPAALDDGYVDLRVSPPDSQPADPQPADPQPSDPQPSTSEPADSGTPDIDLTRAETADAHVVELVETGAFAHAACAACGWTGPARRARAVALRDLHRHP